MDHHGSTFHDTPSNNLNQQDESTCCFNLQNQLNLEREGTKKESSIKFALKLAPHYVRKESSIKFAHKLAPHYVRHWALARMAKTLKKEETCLKILAQTVY
jgi:hypothetical protein